jgi:hypothetical protein
MSRYQVLEADEAVSQGYDIEKFWDWELYDVLVDTERRVVVWTDIPASDCPEDFNLGRLLSQFVSELNRLAEEEATDGN